MPTNQVSIDRITVSGELKAEYRELQRVVNALGSSWELPDGVEHWMRLELQLRGRKPAEWIEHAKSMLADFRLPNYDNIKSVNDKLALAGLDSQFVDWSDFAKEKRARLRKLQKEQYDDTLARELFDLLIEHQERLHGELTSYLAEFDIQE
ncbi:hypothetical protein EFL57_11100 [Weissella confusa]|uniref:hypothetical protein n=1 Tax=Weissella confusa TaxID=1583 RepID=UPI00223AEBB8|nr:hypothetical protein [Weissella confusa]MCT0010949.1 hypothetical protein [Weissella confusa]